VLVSRFTGTSVGHHYMVGGRLFKSVPRKIMLFGITS
jgi:hypothetical protein